MYRKKDPEDFYHFRYGNIEIFIEKQLLFDGSAFLILYVGNFMINICDEEIRITKKQ